MVISWSWFIEKKWCCISEDSPQGERDSIAEKMMLEFGEGRHPVFRATSPLSRGQFKAKVVEDCRYTFVPMWRRLKLFVSQLFL